jgi:hypothetical protein
MMTAAVAVISPVTSSSGLHRLTQEMIESGTLVFGMSLPHYRI